LDDDDPVGRELVEARARALEAGLATFEHDRSTIADAIRKDLRTRLGTVHSERAGDPRSAHGGIYRAAIQACRQAVLAMRANHEIGDDAFHVMEEELDWLEMAVRNEPT
jgi:CPA1 family monovalent cation:H+ antiporter